MSGRTRVTLSDGRRVIGYRKTLRRNERLPPERRPELRLTFMLPAPIAALTLPGIYDCATVDADGLVTVRGRDRGFVLRKAAEFIKGVAAGRTLAEPITAVLFCPAHPGPTPSSPVRQGFRDGYTITVACGAPAVVVTRGTSAEPVVAV